MMRKMSDYQPDTPDKLVHKLGDECKVEVVFTRIDGTGTRMKIEKKQLQKVFTDYFFKEMVEPVTKKTEEQVNPDFDKIIPKCIKELEIKFSEYGNSWLICKTPYWFGRIGNEFQEYKKSMSNESAKRKLLNIINMCAMAYDNLEEGRMYHEQI